ncbi:MAG TPA: alpha/beta fold hydrolase [Pyrinomonadaceae bacterium]|nr:alpha/beta fold hydrolase [Pyrinomonadaceae bacterium]
MTKLLVNDIQIAYADVGTGPPVVLLHGYPFDRTLWTDQVARLANRYRFVTPDLRGHGDSDVGAGVATMDAMAADVAVLMDSLNISHAIIGGLSMGGYVTLAFYRNYPARVKALVLADTRPQADTEEAKQIRAQQVEQVLAKGMSPIVDAMLPKLLAPETVSKRPEVVKRIRDMMFKTKPGGAAAALQGMACRYNQGELLSKINVPTLIVVGSEDAITPVPDSERMHAAISGSRLVIIENAGHVSNVEQPEQFNQAFSDFLARIPE